jgi:hypothetical protein
VLVTQPIVAMLMRVRFTRRIIRLVGVLVMGVMHMWMGVLNRLMLMLVLVVLGQMQPYADPHQQTRSGNLQCERLAE